MTQHLSDQDLTDHLVGIHSEKVEGHLHSCNQCRNELAQIKNSIGMFRIAVRNSSRATPSWDAVAEIPPLLERWQSYALMKWAITAGLIACASLSGLRYGKLLLGEPEKPPTPLAEIAPSSRSQIERDNELLSQIDTEISESVPSSMRPLQISPPPPAYRQTDTSASQIR